MAKELGVDQSTVSRAYRRRRCSTDWYWKERKPGAPVKLSDTDIHYAALLLKRGIVQNAHDIQKKYLPNVTTQTIRTRLRDIGIKAYIKLKKPYISPMNKRRRRIWARYCAVFTAKHWRLVIFSDETKIELFSRNREKWTYHASGEQLQARHIAKTIKHGGGNIMVWGCMTGKGFGRIVRIEGNMDRFQYAHILEYGLLGTLEDQHLRKGSVFFQQDNDPKHTSKFVQEWFKKKHIKILPWPASSPDMNIIENVWKVLKDCIGARDILPSNKDELWVAVQEEWGKLSMDYLDKLYDSMPERVLALKLAHGENTRY